jgi:uncharacterized membrane protein
MRSARQTPVSHSETDRVGVSSARGLAALLALPALAFFPDAAHAQAPQTDKFELAMCNISNVPGVFAALVHQRGAQQWEVEGWYAVPDWGCVLLGSFLRDSVHVYAESRQGGAWKPVETDRSGRLECVDHRKWFYAVAGARECAPGQTRVRFRALQVAPEDARLTWSIGGGG